LCNDILHKHAPRFRRLKGTAAGETNVPPTFLGAPRTLFVGRDYADPSIYLSVDDEPHRRFIPSRRHYSSRPINETFRAAVLRERGPLFDDWQTFRSRASP